MSETFDYEIDHAREGRSHLVMRGTVQGKRRSDLGEALDALLRGISASGGIVIDMSEVTDCDVEAARELAMAQRRIASRGLRTAWITTRPRLRGVAMWIVHAASDPGAMPVADLEGAERWLAGDTARLDALEATATADNRAAVTKGGRSR